MGLETSKFMRFDCCIFSVALFQVPIKKPIILEKWLEKALLILICSLPYFTTEGVICLCSKFDVWIRSKSS